MNNKIVKQIERIEEELRCLKQLKVSITQVLSFLGQSMDVITIEKRKNQG